MVQLNELEHEIMHLHNAHMNDPTDTPIKGKLNHRLNKWFTGLKISIFVANNEQLPWSAGEIGFPTRPMLTKKQTGYDQVGDYNIFVDCGGPLDKGFCGPVVDRKTCADFYGTMFGKDANGNKNRHRFHREIERSVVDPRFDGFYVYVECSLVEWLNYLPPNSPSNDLMLNQKIAAIQSLEVRGAHVMWAGSRPLAARMYRDLVRQWIMKNYWRIIDVGNKETTMVETESTVLGFC